MKTEVSSSSVELECPLKVWVYFSESLPCSRRAFPRAENQTVLLGLPGNLLSYLTWEMLEEVLTGNSSF